ncbi:NAD-dependent epimerase/dehydratase family protein [Pedobacter sp. KR3-3]|uniref:NAD-dependent epimerase/dehydratase family protein n=1 Tax=Pedobacter albus TaxID=3113905 RepID=A0ABU7IAY0_9SPHI|nr:NAD-dependent epimerase/dehydratase family protein [Pedobacter sp. KR3-3]MEE1946640.1 NAD-dependent epimerase/dehydratase family protein [Pedobacter sp. KR3-3]
MEKIRTIITGSTGMVGEGVLYECLQNEAVEAVLVINRKPCGYSHPKLKEIIHADFFDFSPIEEQLTGYNACFFCLGVSSVGMDKEKYYQMTYVLTMHVAETLSKLNTNMTFCYVSGAGTNTSEQGGSNWSRVKGKTENDLMKLPFAQVFNFRPGFIKPIKGLKYAHSFYKYINWLFPIGRALFPNGFCTLQELALAMIHTLNHHNERKAVEGKDIIAMAKEEPTHN